MTEIPTVQTEPWLQHAACKGLSTDIFFPGRADPDAQAKKICRTCPVRAECLTYAMTHGEMFGIWGGLAERERRKLRRQYRLRDAS